MDIGVDQDDLGPAAYRWLIGALYVGLLAANLYLVLDMATDGHARQALEQWTRGPWQRVKAAYARHRTFEEQVPHVIFDAMQTVEQAASEGGE